MNLFYCEVNDETAGNGLNGIKVVRMKDKLGTRQLPTAELILDGMSATKLSAEGTGIRSITDMLNITRLHNSVSAIASMRRVLALARDFADRRVAFGKKLNQLPLQVQVLADLERRYRGNLLFVLYAAKLLGKIENGKADKIEVRLYRVITPVMKLFTAKEAVAFVSEGVECFGAMGYMENSNIPVILRDAQVLPIWEGTTNVLSLDLVRAL